MILVIISYSYSTGSGYWSVFTLKKKLNSRHVVAQNKWSWFFRFWKKKINFSVSLKKFFFNITLRLKCGQYLSGSLLFASTRQNNLCTCHNVSMCVCVSCLLTLEKIFYWTQHANNCRKWTEFWNHEIFNP